MLPFLANAFNDPSNPWYYVIGVLFLLLIFAAFAVYVIWNGKKKKSGDQKETPAEEKPEPKPEQPDSEDAATPDSQVDAAEREQEKETESEQE